jgi:hypothetical protein
VANSEQCLHLSSAVESNVHMFLFYETKITREKEEEIKRIETRDRREGFTYLK